MVLVQFGVPEVFAHEIPGYHQDQTLLASIAWSEVCVVSRYLTISSFAARSIPLIVIFFDWKEMFNVSSSTRSSIFSQSKSHVRVAMLEFNQ